MGHTYKYCLEIINALIIDLKTNCGFESTKVSAVSQKAHFEITGKFTSFYWFHWVLLSIFDNTLSSEKHTYRLIIHNLHYEKKILLKIRETHTENSILHFKTFFVKP